MKTIIIIALLLLLTACGGGGPIDDNGNAQTTQPDTGHTNPQPRDNPMSRPAIVTRN